MTTKPRILVTGGDGFLGSAICRAAQTTHPSWGLYVLDLSQEGTCGRERFLNIDITDAAGLSAALERLQPDVIIHTAGVVPKGQERYSQSAEVKKWTTSVNVDGTMNVLEAARRCGCQAFVYTSSCTVITDDQAHDYPYMDESLSTGNATLAYGVSKTEAERLVLDADCPGMATCALRPCMFIGAGDPSGVIAALHACIARSETPYILGDGNNLYDFTCVDNVADAHILAVENLLSYSKTARGQAFFISNDEPIYFRDFMLAVWAYFGHQPPFQVHIPTRLAATLGLACEWASRLTGREPSFSRGAVMDAIGVRYANIEKAKSVLGYKPRVSLTTGLRAACDDYRSILEADGRHHKTTMSWRS